MQLFSVSVRMFSLLDLRLFLVISTYGVRKGSWASLSYYPQTDEVVYYYYYYYYYYCFYFYFISYFAFGMLISWGLLWHEFCVKIKSVFIRFLISLSYLSARLTQPQSFLFWWLEFRLRGVGREMTRVSLLHVCVFLRVRFSLPIVQCAPKLARPRANQLEFLIRRWHVVTCSLTH